MNKKKKTNLKIETENLAVPEIYVDDEELSEDDDLAESDNGILYENLAVPEIIIKPTQKSGNDKK